MQPIRVILLEDCKHEGCGRTAIKMGVVIDELSDQVWEVRCDECGHHESYDTVELRVLERCALCGKELLDDYVCRTCEDRVGPSN